MVVTSGYLGFQYSWCKIRLIKYKCPPVTPALRMVTVSSTPAQPLLRWCWYWYGSGRKLKWSQSWDTAWLYWTEGIYKVPNHSHQQGVKPKQATGLCFDLWVNNTQWVSKTRRLIQYPQLLIQWSYPCFFPIFHYLKLSYFEIKVYTFHLNKKERKKTVALITNNKGVLLTQGIKCKLSSCKGNYFIVFKTVILSQLPIISHEKARV